MRKSGPTLDPLVRKVTTLAAVIVVALACGWSALGPTEGIVLAIALGAACAPLVFAQTRARTDQAPRA
jgi:hypothetical protein